MASSSTKSEPILSRRLRLNGDKDRVSQGEEARGLDDGLERRPNGVRGSMLWQESNDALGAGSADFDSRFEETTDPAQTTGSREDPVSYERLRWMGKALDEVLAGRDRILNELDTLRISRTWLETSLDGLGQSLAVLSSDSNVAQRATTSHQLVPIEIYETGAESLGTTANSNLPAYALPPASQPSDHQPTHNLGEPAPSIETMIAHVRKDLEKVQEHERAFSATLKSLRSKEDNVNKMQRSLASALKNAARTTEIVDRIVLSNERTLRPMPESPRPDSDLPSIVQQYFDRCGDIGVWLERRDDLREAWAEGAAERELIADRGDELEVTDEEYNEKYQEREAYIERELADAREQADHLRSLCLAGNFDIDRYKRRRRSLTSYGSSEDLSSPHSSLEEIPVAPEIAAQVSSAIARQPAKRISTWLEEVPLNPSETAEEHPEAMTEEPSPGSPGFPIAPQTVPDPYQVPLLESQKVPAEPDIVAAADSSSRVAIREFVAEDDELPTPLATAGLLNVTQDHSLLSPQSLENHSPVPSVSATTTGDTAPTQLTISRRGSEEPPPDSIPCEP